MTFFDGYNEDICKMIGLEEDLVWKYISLDDWDYALIINGKISPRKYDLIISKFLHGCCDNVIKYIPEANKTVCMAYHA